ncbi:hypothetical protein D1AOALGA4SA_1827 [Olavius algarvensis Delta 1 endosymbiont]|nr:hypothetical protein D1AOALGA4SA_1827 [Olavius algarvensis Delta 1 endosymbiont]
MLVGRQVQGSGFWVQGLVSIFFDIPSCLRKIYAIARSNKLALL